MLEVLAGRHLVGRDTVRILGRPAFYDLMLVTSGQLGYLGNQWRRNVACAGSDLALQVCPPPTPHPRTQLFISNFSTRDGNTYP